MRQIHCNLPWTSPKESLQVLSRVMRLEKDATQEGIKVHNLVPGQQVRLIRDEYGTVFAEARVAEGLNFAQFEVPSGQTFKGYFQVTPLTVKQLFMNRLFTMTLLPRMFLIINNLFLIQSPAGKSRGLNRILFGG